jgi:hypothetical protein
MLVLVFESSVVVEQLRAGVESDPAGLSDSALLGVAGDLVRLRALLDAFEVSVVGELDARAVCEAELGLTTVGWLSAEAGLPRSVASARVKVARKLRGPLDAVAEALAAGRISWEHARVLVQACNPRIADEVAAIQTELVELAGSMPFEPWRREVIGIVDLLDEDGGHDPNDDLARNTLSLVPTFDGVTHLSGQLTGEHAAIARQSVHTVADELFRRFKADHAECPELEIPSRATLMALAFVEICRRANATDLTSTVAPRPDVSLVIQADDPTHGRTADGVRLADGTTRVLRCDPEITAIITDRLGVPLDLARKTRWATPAQRRALAVRDGGCCFPGCDIPVGWTDAHHVDHVEHGGPTDLANLALLCRWHHGITHRNGWTMRTGGDGWFQWTTPTGQILHAQRHHRQRTTTQAA